MQPGSVSSAMPADEASLLRRVADLERQLRELGPSVADSFNSTAEQLRNQAVPAVNSGAASGFVLDTVWRSIVSITIPVPAGYTRALVYASGVMTGGNNPSMTATRLYTRVVINGEVGSESNVPMSSTAAHLFASSSAFASANLTGVSGSLSVSIQGRIHEGTTDGDILAYTNSTLAAQAVFLR